MMLTHNHNHHRQQQQQQAQHQLQDQLFYGLHTSPYFGGNDFDLDADLDSISSSPVSTQSFLSQYSNVQGAPLSGIDNIATGAVPRRTQQVSLSDFPSSGYRAALDGGDEPSLFANNDPMHMDSWLPNTQLTPKSAARYSHNRDSSMSSLGSAGPASPYSHNTSNPQIAVTDSIDDFHGLPNGEDVQYHLAKSFQPSTHENFYANLSNYGPADASVNSARINMARVPRQRNERGFLPPPDFPRSQNRSRPASVASSIVSDSPATPAGEPEDVRRQKTCELLGGVDQFVFDSYSPFSDGAASNTVPKLDRTMTDVYNDELYNPNFNITSASPSQIPVTSSNDLFAQRLQAANSQRLSAVHSPVSTSPRDRSPFRHGSPLAPMPSHDFSAMPSTHMGFGSAQQLREQRKAEQDAQAMQQQLSGHTGTDTPQTISPKDAVLEFNSPDGDANFPLFPQQDSNGFDTSQLKGLAQMSQPFNNLQLDGSSFGNYVTHQLPTNLQVPQQYPFVPQQQPRQQNREPSMSNSSMAPSRLSSTESGQSEGVHSSSPQRPAGTSADGGTYTCTYHGCTLRFETPALLQKHKREGHRQSHGLGTQQRKPDVAGAGMTSNLLNSQAGPHRCDRINPSTGKSCNTIFSRPYDLTRHEDTIHNARKQKVRCDLCTDEKTFSRADALTRHYRVCHPDVEFPGKHRKRGGGQSV
ncbi:hypothetical protein QBC33DRAFT_146284 [Phialemonium atrogriseum]|uniref:C2H2-type domain-containing protein n=1 Tax=Phialemonium atrogriseum TaxID=1093897 RepID=A0AAJ0C0S3_9PEZI|nr:uncharacterized protein QBC33DRAFT_146284 [Phialemonium atrogriseum]KAK1765576.1 hypothetical protein QBC33DRAFT_146284 [Phialemonium atrogriseum]